MMRPLPLLSALLGLLALATNTLAQEVAPPAPEQRFTATVDVVERFVQDIGGSQDVYRSIVDLGEGPKLLSGSGQFVDPSGKLADRIDFSAYGWGGDPYNTARVDAELADVYRFKFDYRNVIYFNSLPSFANPFLSEGTLLSQRALDVARRQFDTELEIKPNSTISPFVAHYRGSGLGSGITTFVVDGDEFPVSTDFDDTVDSVRGGVRVNLSKIHLTLEQGYTRFDDGQQISFLEEGAQGNRRRTFLGQDLVLDDLTQNYDVEGSGVFNRGVIQGHPWKQLSFSGQFLYSQPDVDVRYDHTAMGNFITLLSGLPFTTGLENSMGDAKWPHASGSWSTEIRPVDRVRIVQSWFTDRFHISAGSFLNQTFNTEPETGLETQSFDRMVLNYSQHQVDAMVDVNPNVTVRGGHRIVWGDALVRPATLQFTETPNNTAEVRRNVGLAGVTFRAGSKLSTTVDFEASPGDKVFFRTGLMDYRQLKVRSRYRLHPELTLSGSYSWLDNENDAPDIRFDFQSQRTSLSLFWTPNNGERFTLLADYTRATIRSDIPIVSLPFLGTENARYRDKGNHAGLFTELRLPRDVRLKVGGSFSINEGSRPTRYYQPQGRLIVPLVRNASWISEWRWYGFDERLFPIENFRTHMFSTGLRLSL